MPHQCTNCGLSFEDGSKEMLSGCPECGGNKFQFHPSDDDVPEEPDATAEPPEPPGPDSSVARTVGNAAATVRNLVGGSGSGSPGPTTTPPDDGSSGSHTTGSRPGDAASSPAEDTAQANARSEVVSPDEIPSSGWGPTDDTDRIQSDAPTVSPSASESEPAGEQQADDLAEDRPDLAQLREELNDQFESIKILSPGTYELNLMELYDREEYIIALQEDGRYTIQVPETWHE